MAVATYRKSLFERVGVHGFVGGKHTRRHKNNNNSKYGVHEEDGYMEMVQIGAERTKNVLILMSDTGGGHRASAEAIRDAFHLQFGDQYRVLSLFLVSITKKIRF